MSSTTDASVLQLFTNGPVERFGQHQRVSLIDGTEYRGDITEGRRHGLGMMTWRDGLRYVGEWLDNCATGDGVLSWPDGSEYYGRIHSGRRHGQGLFINGSGHYAGEWHNGLRHGIGTQTSSEVVYCGEWSGGRRHGWGSLQFESGNSYDGCFADDNMSGFGCMTWVTVAPAAADTSAVSLEETTLDLARTMVSNVGALSPGPLGPFTPSVATTEAAFEKYIGEWQDGLPHGKGEFAAFFHDGVARDNPFQTINHFVGEFAHGKRHGHGVQLYADGSVFEGVWQNNTKVGQGFLTRPNGLRTTVSVVNDTILHEGDAAEGAESATAEDAVSIGDIATEPEIAAAKGMLANYRPILRYLYGVYSTIPQQAGTFKSVEQLLRVELGAPTPQFLSHRVLAGTPPTHGISRVKRNKRLCNTACENIHKEVEDIANRIIKRMIGVTKSLDTGMSERSMSFTSGGLEAALKGDVKRPIISRNTIDVTMPVAHAPHRNVLHTVVTRYQFLQLLTDARVLDVALPPAKVNAIIHPAVSRDPNRKVSSRPNFDAFLRSEDNLSDHMSFGVFVEAIIRVAEARMGLDGPWFASCLFNGLSFAERLQIFCNLYITPLGAALINAAAACDLRVLGIEPFLPVSSGNQTMLDLRRNAARALKERGAKVGATVGTGNPPQASSTRPNSRQSEEDPLGESTSSLRIGSPEDDFLPSAAITKVPLRLDGTAGESIQVWRVDCTDLTSNDPVSYWVSVHVIDGKPAFGGIQTHSTRTHFSSLVKSGRVQDWLGVSLPLSPYVVLRVPFVAELMNKNLVALLHLFESLQRSEVGVCTLMDLLNVLTLGGFFPPPAPKKRRITIDPKPKPPTPPPASPVKGKRGSSALSQPRKSTQKLSKKQLQILEAKTAEEAAARAMEEEKAARHEALVKASRLKAPEEFEALPSAKVTSQEELFRHLAFHLLQTVVDSHEISSFAHVVAKDSSLKCTAALDVAPALKMLCKASHMLDEAVQLQHTLAEETDAKAALVSPVITTIRGSGVMLSHNVWLSFDDFLAALVVSAVVGFPTRTPLQAVKCILLYLPRLISVAQDHRAHIGLVPPVLATHTPLPVRPRTVPEDSKPKKKR